MKKMLRYFSLGLLLVLALTSCKKEIKQTVYDNTIYEVNPVTLYQSNADKNKQKSSTQYISILYTDLFSKSVSSTDLNNLSEVSLSIGDKGMANELILQRALNQQGIKIPTATEMRSDVDKFTINTYQHFYLRNPNEYEKYYFRNLINNDASITPELIYASFILSNEYLFY